MQAGRLRHRITLIDRGRTSDGRGGFTTAGETTFHARLPANVTPLTGRELTLAQQIDPRSRFGVQVRYMAGLDTRMRLIYHAVEGDQSMDILDITDEDERHREMTLLCAEAV